jgi:small subunit ribosomal protein S2
MRGHSQREQGGSATLEVLVASAVTMKQLLEAGVHFGHRTRRWNPKMRQYIFTERSGIHIIDLHQTMTRINEFYEMVRRLVAGGGTILFVGTKRQAQGTVEQEATRCGMPYIHNRWLGGTLTNWATIKKRIDYLNRQERRKANGEFQSLPKIEQLVIDRELAKLNRRIGGIKTLTEMPNLIFVIDTQREELAVKEANKIGIPLIAVADTNSDPDEITYVIPGNDDAIRAVKLITQILADAVEEGRRFREVDMVETGQVSDHELAELEQYLGPSTLAKLQGMDEEEEGAAEGTADGAGELAASATEKEEERQASAETDTSQMDDAEAPEQTDTEPVGEEG